MRSNLYECNTPGAMLNSWFTCFTLTDSWENCFQCGKTIFSTATRHSASFPFGSNVHFRMRPPIAVLRVRFCSSVALALARTRGRSRSAHISTAAAAAATAAINSQPTGAAETPTPVPPRIARASVNNCNNVRTPASARKFGHWSSDPRNRAWN